MTDRSLANSTRSNTKRLMNTSNRVLSIQSHMVSGYCGNKAAAFPLQTLGFEVDILNTVQFSNHTGYPSWKGGRLTAEDVQDLFDGMEENGLIDDYTHVLTGYIGNYDILNTIHRMVVKLKAKNKQLIYVCDPVMGDDGTLYVKEEIVPLYRTILKITDIVTPNQFEAEKLTGHPIKTLMDARNVASILHGPDFGVPNVVITSVLLPSENGVPALYCLVSQRTEDGSPAEQHLISFPTYQGYFTGTGDLFSALMVARFEEAKGQPSSLARAALKVVSSVNTITKLTWERQRQYAQEGLEGKPNDPALTRHCELLVVKGKKMIEEPEQWADSLVMEKLPDPN